ncbi:lactam utilization protein LamB [Sporolactobacillus inulinus]|uniref:Lactam utilization protein LamB n=1 Tax=Sporolactobacillus inulinus TaxID=2078 RepID=A0A4Y1Z7S3_9BACL|nr:lactam utilization protein LamB [Sporolactobacillus inulinus]
MNKRKEQRMNQVDLNCDLGESFGHYVIGNDEAVLPLISSANVACGFHAGDYSEMRRTVLRAKKNRVAIGAHPGLPDLKGFGRREMDITPTEIYDMIVYQIGALQAVAAAQKVDLNHVKPHGALYHMASDQKNMRMLWFKRYVTSPQICFCLAWTAPI